MCVTGALLHMGIGVVFFAAGEEHAFKISSENSKKILFRAACTIVIISWYTFFEPFRHVRGAL
jgi:hypothetical protein